MIKRKSLTTVHVTSSEGLYYDASPHAHFPPWTISSVAGVSFKRPVYLIIEIRTSQFCISKLTEHYLNQLFSTGSKSCGLRVSERLVGRNDTSKHHPPLNHHSHQIEETTYSFLTPSDHQKYCRRYPIKAFRYHAHHFRILHTLRQQCGH